MSRILWIALVAITALIVALNIRHWWRGIHGLDQWPYPYGRYYKRWMSLPDESANYYEWLAREMDNKDPWKMWAEMERDLP
ncbi:MAG TPA: hypothetical protein VJN43_05930 [Bryobacteraceae bacterium]|nr:hypothetical protein [Bryobacteraceae bacterium]